MVCPCTPILFTHICAAFEELVPELRLVVAVIRTFFRRNNKLEKRVAVIRQMEVAKRNHIHANKEIKILKFAVADLQSLDHYVVREHDIDAIDACLIKSLRRVGALSVRREQPQSIGQGFAYDRVDCASIPQSSAFYRFGDRTGHASHDANVGDDGTD